MNPSLGQSLKILGLGQVIFIVGSIQIKKCLCDKHIRVILIAKVFEASIYKNKKGDKRAWKTACPPQWRSREERFDCKTKSVLPDKEEKVLWELYKISIKKKLI